MARYEVHGIKLRVPGRAMNAELRQALESGNYEWNERLAITRHVTPEDRVLDIGAGVGFIASLAAKVVGGDRVTVVEASPVLQEVLRSNLDENGARGAKLVHAAVVPENHAGDTVTFAVTGAFWASALADHAKGQAEKVTVPAVKLSDLMAAHRPTIVVMDVEGAEVEICEQEWPASVRLLILEIHTGKYPPRSVKRLFDGLSAQGFTIMPWGTRGEVIALQRVYDDAGRVLGKSPEGAEKSLT